MPFSKETLDFLFENKLQNSKMWYEEHKAQYQTLVLDPLQQLVEALGPTMFQLDPQLIIQPKVGKCISRIYRDTRFSKDKTLFRDVMWIVFHRDKKAYEGPPSFFCEISPDGFRYGCGHYYMPPQLMEAARNRILQNSPGFQKAFAAMQNHREFFIEGESYKRSRFPEEPPEKADWLNRKNLCFVCVSRDFELLFSDRLAAFLAEGFQVLKPIYEFLWEAQEDYLHELREGSVHDWL